MSDRTVDTSPIRSEERFDEDRVAAYLQANLPEFFADRPVTFDQFPGGRANLTYRVVAGDIELVLRRAPLGAVARGGHDMAREHRVLSRLWMAYPLAPRAYHFCGDPSVMGKPFFVMQRLRGHVIRATWPSAWQPDDDAIRVAAAESVVAALADLHLVEPHSVGLEELGHPDGFVARQIEGWAKRWEAAHTRRLPEMEASLEILRASVPIPQTATILHNDFKLDNTMMSDDGEVVAVFDWDMSTLGDPLVDLGTFLAYWSDTDGPTYKIFGRRAMTLAPYLSRSEVLSRYADTTGLDLSGVRFYEGLALFRIAAIIEQIYARFVAGQTTDARFEELGPLVPVLAAASLEVLEGRD